MVNTIIFDVLPRGRGTTGRIFKVAGVKVGEPVGLADTYWVGEVVGDDVVVVGLLVVGDTEGDTEGVREGESEGEA